uniref:deoxyribonuclease II n=2 Tax=Kryptolebias marmoratus TaxID=37003 RepID=A0A3Q3H0V3_KRYMA
MWRLLLTFSLMCCSCEGWVTCKDEDGNPKDWYILYKEPESKVNAPTSPEDGFRYIYIDEHGMKKGNKLINNPNGVLAHTLEPIFKPKSSMKSDFGFISYSDQHSTCQVGTAELAVDTVWDELLKKPITTDIGHSKGVLMVEKNKKGVWLLHSTPQFPSARDQDNFWPNNGFQYGQTFICVTFDYLQFKNIGKHLQYIGACVFDYQIPEDFFPELKDAASRKILPPNTAFVSLTSSGGQEFKSIAKKKFGLVKGGDLYVTISDAVDSDLHVQTWGRQTGRRKSYCKSKHEVLNIEEITTDLGTWKDTDDHSKWCVSTHKEHTYVCVADVNRAPSQFKRRGGALCIQHATLTETFQNFVSKTEPCKGTMATIFSVAQQGLDFVKYFAHPLFF